MWWKRPRIVYIDTRVVFLKIVFAILVIVSSFLYWRWTKVTEIEFVSYELASSWVVRDNAVINKVCSGLEKLRPVQGKTDSSGILVKIKSKKEVREYQITDQGFVLDIKSRKVFYAPDTLKQIVDLAERELKNRSPYGELLDWQTVRSNFHVGKQVVIRDLDSGQKFNVKRTGGFSHADIEPLSESDTTMIKKLYKGNLSWKRKAVVVELEGRKIASSFTGAATGNGEIMDNGVSGKMNLYFNESKSENGRNLSHQVMIWKAAGKTQQQLQKLSPEKTIMVLFTAIDQQDLYTLNRITNKAQSLTLEKVIGVTVRQITRTGDLKYRITVSVSLKGGPYNERRIVQLSLNEAPKGAGFKAGAKFLAELLRQ